MKTLQRIILCVMLFSFVLVSNTVFGQNKGKFYATMQTRDAQGLKINHPDDIDIIYSLNEYSAVYLGPDAAEELHHKVLAHGPGFIYEPSKESAISTVNSSGPLSSKSQLLNTSLISFAITQEALVNQSLNLVNNLNIADHITELENYGTRYHTTTSATQSVLDLKTKWEALAGNRADVSVRIVDHTSTNMPSVIMTITGSESPDEFVIIGGHIDSTAFGNNNNAPGADDNASGIATITEAARVLFEMNFQPKRTIEFMAFAAEEVGLRGSQEIATSYSQNNVNVVSYLQLDMTNYKGSTNDIYISTDSYNDDDLNNFLIQLMNFYNASGTHQITYGTSQCNYGCSDHYSWAQQGYNVAFPFEATFNESNPNIHTTGDTSDKFPTANATHAAKFAKLALEYLIEISNETAVDVPAEECSQTITSFPYEEDFENTIGAWTQNSNDDLNFTINSGTTPSSGTGPDTAASGSYYLYVEASGNGTGYPDKTAILSSPCFDLTSLTSPELSFQYHMLGSAIASLTVEASTNNSGNWTSISTITGEQGGDWNTAAIDVSSLANESNVQFRISVVTGSGDSGWQSDIAIDALSVSNDTEDPNPTTCESLNFNNFSVTSFSNQDSDGTFNVTNAGNTLSLTNNTWKYIALNYEVTSSTVVEFEFSSTSEGEIHGVGFENDNTLTSSMYFKVHGSQNYGTTNYDNYVSGTTTYIIPIGSFYTGTMDRLVFLNDNDSGTGNTSTFSNVKIYEGTCEASSRKTVSSAVTPIYGNTTEGILAAINISPNPSANIFSIHVKNKGVAPVNAMIYSVSGKKILEKTLQEGVNTISAKKYAFATGVYLIKIETKGEESITKKIIIK